jgi:hypothetical protein
MTSWTKPIAVIALMQVSVILAAIVAASIYAKCEKAAGCALGCTGRAEFWNHSGHFLLLIPLLWTFAISFVVHMASSKRMPQVVLAIVGVSVMIIVGVDMLRMLLTPFIPTVVILSETKK